MEKEEYKLHAIHEKDNWWFISKRRNIQYLLNRYVKPKGKLLFLDIGCGSGANSEIFTLGCNAIGVDISYEALNDYRHKKYKYLICADGNRLPIADSCVDTVLVLDALEHLDDDRALSDIHRICKPGGLIVLTVPAYSFLWTLRDLPVGHKRRYSISQLREKMIKYNFQVKKITYLNAFLFFPLLFKAIAERWLKIKTDRGKGSIIVVSPFLNKILVSLLNMERILWILTGLAFGTSIICVAENEAR